MKPKSLNIRLLMFRNAVLRRFRHLMAYTRIGFNNAADLTMNLIGGPFREIDKFVTRDGNDLREHRSA